MSLACWAQVPPERTNTYAEPALVAGLSSMYAPTTAVSPDTATETPKRSPPAASAPAVSLACWAQVTPERTNTYAEPASPAGLSSKYAPTTTVSPDTAAEIPKRSPPAASEAVSLACWAQVTPERTNT